MRQSNASVASRTLDYSSAWSNKAPFFGIFDDKQSCSVFDTAAWILELGFP
jgi:hypothetical protein